MHLCNNKKRTFMMSYETVLQTMLAMENDEQRAVLQRFFKTGKGQYGEGDLFLGIKVPQTRAVCKQYWKACTLDDLDKLVRSPYHEVRLLALLMLVQQYKHDKKNAAYADFYLLHTDFINNWDLVDLSCYDLLGSWLLDKDRGILYTLADKGRHIWEQRIGVVSTMQFLRHNQLDDTCAIADIFLAKPSPLHDLLQKAVGWLLREAGKRNGSRLTAYLATRYRAMPRTMLRYAIEKYPDDVRKRFLDGTFEK